MKVTFCTLFFLALATVAAVPHPGPRSEAEANLLFFEGQGHFDAGRFSQAAHAFQRLVDRYPRHPQALDANRYLGDSYLKSRRANLAVAPLTSFIKTSPIESEQNGARLLLIETYQILNQNSEGKAATEELLRQNPEPAVQAEALLWKAIFLAREQRIESAQASFDAYQTLIKEKSIPIPKPALEAKFRLEHGAARCEAISFPKKLKPENEARWLDGLAELQSCYQDSVLFEVTTATADDRFNWCKRFHQHTRKIQNQNQDPSFARQIDQRVQAVIAFAKKRSRDLISCEKSPLGTKP